MALGLGWARLGAPPAAAAGLYLFCFRAFVLAIRCRRREAGRGSVCSLCARGRGGGGIAVGNSRFIISRIMCLRREAVKQKEVDAFFLLFSFFLLKP